MTFTLKPYAMVLRNSMMSGLAYRAHFIFMALGNIIYVVVSFFLWKSIYGAQETLNGLSFQRAFLQIALSMGLFGLLQNWIEWFMSSQIQNGDIVRYLTRPLDYELSMIADAGGGTLVNLVGIALPTFAMGFALAGLPLPHPAALAAFVVAVILAFFISFFIDYLIGLLSFVTTTVWGISATKEIIVLFFSGALIPLAFFPPVLQEVLLWLPFNAMYQAPLSLILDPGMDLQGALGILALQVVWVVVLLGASRLAWHRMVRHMVINGG